MHFQYGLSAFQSLLITLSGIVMILQAVVEAQNYDYSWQSSRGVGKFSMSITQTQGPLVDAEYQTRKIRDFMLRTFTHIGDEEHWNWYDVADQIPATIASEGTLQVVAEGEARPIYHFEKIAILIGLENYYRQNQLRNWARPATFTSEFTWGDPPGSWAPAAGSARGSGSSTHGQVRSTSSSAALNNTRATIQEVQTSKRFRTRRDTALTSTKSGPNTTLGVIPVDPFVFGDDWPRETNIWDFTVANTPVSDMQDVTIDCWTEVFQDWLLFGGADKFHDFGQDTLDCGTEEETIEIYLEPSDEYEDKRLSWDIVIDTLVAVWHFTTRYMDARRAWMPSANIQTTRKVQDEQDLEHVSRGWLGRRDGHPDQASP